MLVAERIRLRKWARGHHQEVLTYLAQDVRTPVDVGRAYDDRLDLQAGQPARLRSPSGLAPSHGGLEAARAGYIIDD